MCQLFFDEESIYKFQNPFLKFQIAKDKNAKKNNIYIV